MTTDSELLRRYADTRSEEAFAELVRRHVNLVYSAALRQVNGDAHLAQDVAQTVFTDLARKAGSLARREVLTGWLYTSAHFAATKIVRTENRRRDREEQFMRESIHETAPEVGRVTPCAPDWEKIRPSLDEVMHELKEADREAILLRYFENRPFAEIGGKFGLNENAALMRVERALEKLRAVFLRRGIAATTALASVISANAVQIAPAGLAATLTSASLAGAGTGTFTLLKIMIMTKLKLGLGALVIAGATTALVVQHQTQTRLREENESLTGQIAQLQSDNGILSNRLATVSDSKKLTDEQLSELLKLRSEVGLLRQQTNKLGKLRDQSERRETTQTKANDATLQRIMQENARMNDAMILCRSMQEYVFQYQRQPVDLDQLNPFIGTPLARTNQFEIVNEGTLTNLPYPETIIVLREKEARSLSNGKLWERIYGFADGNIKQITSQDGNFDTWEKKHMVTPPNQETDGKNSQAP